MTKNNLIPILCILLCAYTIITTAFPTEPSQPISIDASTSISSTPTTTTTTSSTFTSTSDIDPGYDKEGARYLFTISFVVMQLNVTGSIYVLYRTYKKYRSLNKKSSLSMALRVPFYIAISDLNLYCVHMVNQGYTLLHQHTWEGEKCKVVGGVVFFFVAANMTLVGTIALVTYLRVCRRVTIDLGPYDRNLFATVFGFPLILTLCSIPSFGPSTYWCYTNKTNHIMPIITFVLTSSVLTLNTACYYLTFLELKKSKSQFAVSATSSIQSGTAARLSENAQRLERRVARKIATYMLMFSVQWTPAMPYVIASIIMPTPSVALYILCDIAINLGGIGNGIQYIINEGWSTSSTESIEEIDDQDAKKSRRQIPSVIYVTRSVNSEITKYQNHDVPEILDSLYVEKEKEGVSIYSQDTMVAHEGIEDNCKNEV